MTGKTLDQIAKTMGGFDFNIFIPEPITESDLEEYIKVSLSESAAVIAKDFHEKTGEYEGRRHLIISAQINIALVAEEDEQTIIDLLDAAEIDLEEGANDEELDADTDTEN